MAERVQIVVEAKDLASGVMRGIMSQFGTLGNIVQELTVQNINWGNVAEQATRLVIEGLKESIRYSMEYASQVRTLAQVSGTGAEETSRFIQVLDDYGLTANDALVAARNLNRQGLAPTIETLGKLSDQYRAANTIQEKNEILTKNLGRAGLEWANVLSRGSEGLRAQADAVNQNLVLNEQALVQARVAAIAWDDWDDSVNGLKNSIGQDFVGIMTGATEEINRNAQEIFRATHGYNINTNALSRYSEAQREAWAEAKHLASEEYIASKNLGLVGGAADKAADNFSDLIKLTMEFSKTTQAEMPKVAYQNLIASLSVDGLTEAELNMATTAGVALGIFDQSAADSAMALDELNRKFAAGELSAKEYAAAVRSIPSSINTTLTLNIDNQTGSYVGDPSGGADLNPETPYARGGYVSGRGTGYSDSVRARLSNGEYVMNSDATRQNLSLLEALNNGAQTSGTNIFYGPVTLTVDEGAGGLLTLR